MREVAVALAHIELALELVVEEQVAQVEVDKVQSLLVVL
jgi:hypothetical protein